MLGTPWRPIRIPLISAAFAVITITVVFVGLRQAPANAGGPYRMHQLNIAGVAFNNGGDASAATTVYSVNITEPRPLVISTNEVCLGQYEYMHASFAPQGYEGYLTNQYFGDDLGSVPDCEVFGTALFVLGGQSETVRNHEFTQPTQIPGSTTRADYVCMRSAFSFVGCATHLVSAGLPGGSLFYTRRQSDEYFFDSENAYGSGVIFRGGDFNLRTDDIGTNLWYDNNFEADGSFRGPGARPTLDSGCCKYDYFWGRNSNSFSDPPARITPVGPSDHHYYDGTFYF